MKEIEYPKYEENEKLNRKILPEDVPIIKARYASGEFIRSIAKSYGVHYDTIYSWINDEYRQKKRKKTLEYLKSYKRSKEKQYGINKRFKKRKKLLKPIFTKWSHQQDKKCEFFKEYKKRSAVKSLEYYYKNRNSILLKNKLKNLKESIWKQLLSIRIFGGMFHHQGYQDSSSGV